MLNVTLNIASSEKYLGESIVYFDPADLVAFDAVLKDVEREANNNADLVHQLSRFSLKGKSGFDALLCEDPYSLLYAEKIKEVHREITGIEHSSNLEGLPVLDLAYESLWPYPWGTKCPETVGNFLIAYGFAIRSANLPPNARVLEVGCGMGSLTWNLARMGYRVDALDPNSAQCAAVEAFTKDLPTKPNVIAATLDQWLSTREKHYKYDAVIFFESFHHLMDHQHCLETLLAHHMESDAKLLLAAEPILEDVSDILPYPWGPRLDGESLRAMRRWGWVELGFTRGYLEGLFERLGLQPKWFSSDIASPYTRVLCGVKPSPSLAKGQEPVISYHSEQTSPFDLSIAGLPDYIKRCSGLSGREPMGRWSDGDLIQIEFVCDLPNDFDLELKLVDVFGPNVRKTLRVRVGKVEQNVALEPIGSRSIYTFAFRNVNSNSIEIYVPHPCRPKDLPELQNEDSRRIGIAIRLISIIAVH